MTAFALRLDKRITIQSAVNVKSASGGNTVVWADLATIWSGIRNLSGNERRSTGNGGEVAVARTEFKIRYYPGLDASMRVRYGGAIYNITHVNNYNEANVFMVLTCDTGANDG